MPDCSFVWVSTANGTNRLTMAELLLLAASSGRLAFQYKRD
jgi:hypothetical protein